MFFFIVFSLLFYLCMVRNISNCYFLMNFFFVHYRRKKYPKQVIVVIFKSYFWYELANFHNCVLISMFRFKLLDFFLSKHVIITDGMIRNVSGLLIYGLLKRNFVEILAQSIISPTFQTKINLKTTASR